ncbi:MAG: PP2C family protein-serine/threonine phosphatase [Bacteroidota bacterium]
MTRLRSLLPFIGVFAIAVVVVVLLYPNVHPLGGLRLPYNDDESASFSRRTLDSLSINTDGLTPFIDFRYDRPLLRQLHEMYGIEGTNALMDKIPVGSWQIRWRSDESLALTSGGSNEDAKRIIESMKGQVTVRQAANGGLLSLEWKVEDSVAIASVSLEEARRLAREILSRTSALKAFIDYERPVSEKSISQLRRSDYEFVWGASIPGLPNSIQVKTLIAGSILANLETDLKIPQEFTKAAYETAVQIIVVFVYVIVIASMIFFAFRRFRSFEIGFRLATVVGILAALVMAMEILLSIKDDIGWGLVIALLLGPLFVGGALVLVWAVSESVGREVWKEKFISLDLLSNGHILHSRIGTSIVQGFAIGAGATAVLFGCLEIAGNFVNMQWVLEGDSLRHEFDVALPWVYVIGHSVYTSAFFFALFILFAVSYLRRWITSPLILLLTASLSLSLVQQGDLFPLAASLLIQTIVAFVFIWSFYRFDALTSFLGLAVFSIIQGGGTLFIVGHPGYESSGLWMLSFFAVLFVGSIAVQFRKKEIADFDSITPAFVRHITERHRLQQELEIARQVQMSFLPKENPKVPGLDIDSRCVPALEVGGDYYDFIRFSPKRLAVAIGDVSGKGTQAAFYMTLAKGFLRALSDPGASVSKVLTQINKLFYDNVERGAFISMVYGVFDLTAKTLHMTRAGHNPVLVWSQKKNKLDIIQPNGLALGLEDGRQFSKTIQEVRIPFGKGDMFIFYTDGFTEAMSKSGEEYGDERFAESVKAQVGKPSSEVITGLLKDVATFIGKAKQHDDMTIVVVRAV